MSTLVRCSIVVLLLLAANANAQPAEVIFHGGDVLTMDDKQPAAQAVAVTAGKITAVGSDADIMKLRGEQTRVVDLQGRALLPGFFDSHGHAYMIGLQASSANMLPPPDGGVDSIDKLVETLKTWADQNKVAVDRVGWIVGFGYDNAQLKEQRHPTRDDLDRVSKDVPVIIIHQSGHVGVGNSKALEVTGITADTKDPPGGRFARRDGSNEPNGYAEEYAFFQLVGSMAKKFDDQVSDLFVERGTELLASFGYTTGQEGRAMRKTVAAMQRVADAGKLKIDLVAYPDILEMDDVEPSRDYKNRFRIPGYKLTIDGSPQGKTAWLSRPYFVAPPGQAPDYCGYSAITPKQVHDAVEKAYAHGWQIMVHANGDAAIDTMIGAVRMARQKHPDVDNRPVLIHGQTLRHDQVPLLDQLGIFPSLFPMHTFYWGDYHRDSVLGPERAENISPTGWVRARGMMFGSHHDAPVALPDSMRILSATVTRRSRTGDILGPMHRVDVTTALKAMTIWPAWQHFEEKTKGSIEVGKIADFVVLSESPLKVPQEKLADLKVMETIKDGQTIYKRDAKAAARLLPPALGLFTDPRDAGVRRVPTVSADGCFNPAVSIIVHSMTRSSSSADSATERELLRPIDTSKTEPSSTLSN